MNKYKAFCSSRLKRGQFPKKCDRVLDCMPFIHFRYFFILGFFSTGLTVGPSLATAQESCVNVVSVQSSIQEETSELRLQTPRLSLRPLASLEDALALMPILNDPQVLKYENTAPVSLRQLRFYLSHGLRSLTGKEEYQSLRINFGLYRESRLVGMAQLYPYDEDKAGTSVPAGEKWLSIGIVLRPSDQKQGFAAEVVDRLSSFALEYLGVIVLHSEISKQNTDSNRLFERNDFYRGDQIIPSRN